MQNEGNNVENQTERQSINKTVNVTMGKENKSVEVVFDLPEEEIEEIKEDKNIFKVNFPYHKDSWCRYNICRSL